MFQFSIGRIPVVVHVSHLIMSALLAFSFAQGAGEVTAWPGRILSDVQHPQYHATFALCIGLWMVMISGSVLAHELGHAASAQRWGYTSRIHLVGLGGLTHAAGSEAMPFHQDVLFSLAGPAAGLSLGVLAGVLHLTMGVTAFLPQGVNYVLQGLFYVNLFWTILNLLPISTLDGGRVASAVCIRILGRPGYLVAQIASLTLGGAFILWGVLENQPFLAIIFGFLTLRSISNITAYKRGELPLGQATHPMHAVMLRAEECLTQDKLTEARTTAQTVLAQAPPLSLRNRAMLTLGWIALKEGQGASALESFKQIKGMDVPPQALAAAYSLCGDETQAIPLWAQAVEESKNTTVLHEFAGALLRAGREAEMRSLPNVRPSLAYLAAERVHALRRVYESAAVMAEAAFHAEPNATLAYNAACDWALAGHAEAAMRMLTLAVQNGFDDRQHAATDVDLSLLAERPEFQAWLSSLPDVPTTSPT